VRRYIARRVAAFVATLFFVSALVFVVVRVLPGDPALVIIGPEGSPEAAARLREALGLNRPILVQYTEWLTRAVRGDLGVLAPVRRAGWAPDREPASGDLAAHADGGCAHGLDGDPLGLYAARRHRRAGDYVAMVVSQIGIAIPGSGPVSS
jgi:peptide/nickel transport system permease protein